MPGAARQGDYWHGRLGLALQGASRFLTERRGRLGKLGFVGVCPGTARQAGLGRLWNVGTRKGKERQARQGFAVQGLLWNGFVRHVRAWQARLGLAVRVVERPGLPC